MYTGEVIVVDIDNQDFIMNPEVLEPVMRRIGELKAEGR